MSEKYSMSGKKTTSTPKNIYHRKCHLIHKTNNNNLILVSKTKQSNYITRKYENVHLRLRCQRRKTKLLLFGVTSS